MIHENVLFGWDYDDESNTIIAKDWIRNYGFFSTYTLLLTSIMTVYKKYKVLPENVDSKNALHLLKKEVDKDFDIYNYMFKIDREYDFPDISLDNFNFSPDEHHTIYKEENIKYFSPFFEKYFKLSENLDSTYHKLKEKYCYDFDNTIAVIYRDSDKWTDFGGFNYVSAGAYMRLVKDIKTLNPNHKIVIQTENEGVRRHFESGMGCFYIEETKSATTNYSAPLIHFNENILDWASNYVSSLYLHAQASHLITYTGNSSFFLYLKRGTTKNMHQEITFTKNYSDFFIANN